MQYTSEEYDRIREYYYESMNIHTFHICIGFRFGIQMASPDSRLASIEYSSA